VEPVPVEVVVDLVGLAELPPQPTREAATKHTTHRVRIFFITHSWVVRGHDGDLGAGPRPPQHRFRVRELVAPATVAADFSDQRLPHPAAGTLE
jgi:hypothetical protein